MKTDKTLFLPLLTVFMLVGCTAGSEPSEEALARVMPPKYLEISAFKTCLQSRQVGSHEEWCMPASRPGACPDESWSQLEALTGNDRPPSCP